MHVSCGILSAYRISCVVFIRSCVVCHVPSATFRIANCSLVFSSVYNVLLYCNVI